MDLRCPKCNSADLKKVSLVYEEGLSRVDARTRLRAVAVGGNGPDLVVGRATTQGSQQSALSRKLSPPVKWSYKKAIFRSGLLFLCGGWVVFYVNTLATKSSTVWSPPLTLFTLMSAAGCALVLFLIWRHNQAGYAQEYARWDRAFICQRCGAVTDDVIGELTP
jgi:hypothetical protein